MILIKCRILWRRKEEKENNSLLSFKKNKLKFNNYFKIKAKL
jgi:hypothetical protein